MKPVFFIAIPKTGSLSISHALSPHFSRPYSREQVLNLSPNIFKRIVLQNPIPLNVDYVYEHFPLGTAKLIRKDFFRFTFLRHPVTRTISSLQHCLGESVIKTPMLSSKTRKLSPVKFARYCLENNLFCNAMVHQLSGTEDLSKLVLRGKQKIHGNFYYPYLHAKKRVGKKELEIAKSNLLKLDFFGFFERIKEDFHELSSRLEIETSLPSVKYNKTKKRKIFKEAKPIIREMNALDLELYRFALQNIERR